ncbi:MAG: AAA family ATPase, partial [Myxococcota bacterium]
VLGQDGYGLATLIDYLKGYAPEQFEQLNDAIHEVIPSVQRVRTGRQKLDLEIPVNQAQKQYFNYPIAPVSVIGNALILDMVGAPNLPAHAVSEGTLLVLGILTLMLSPNGPEVLLLDDIGQGLHPYAQQKLIPALRRVLDLNPKLQIIFTTHSPNIIDEMKPHEVQVVAADSEGVSHVRCLSEHPNVERALEVLTTGEFLGAEGESWVIEADPHSGGSDAADGGVG